MFAGFDIALVIAGGLLAGLVGSLMGLGGGIIAVPFLNLVLGIPMHTAAAAGLVSTLCVSCSAAGRYLRRGGMIDIPLALRLELFAAAGGLLGGFLVGWLSGSVLQVLFGATMAYAAIHILRTAHQAPMRQDVTTRKSSWRMPASYLLCLVAGVMSGLFGIGGGIVMVPVLHLFLALPFKHATATSNFMMGLTAVSALCGFVARQQLDLAVSGPLAAGVVVGALAGAKLMPRLRTPLLKRIFGIVLALTAFEMARKGMTSW